MTHARTLYVARTTNRHQRRPRPSSLSVNDPAPDRPRRGHCVKRSNRSACPTAGWRDNADGRSACSDGSATESHWSRGAGECREHQRCLVAGRLRTTPRATPGGGGRDVPTHQRRPGFSRPVGRNRIGELVPLRAILSSSRPSWSLSRRTRAGSPPPERHDAAKSSGWTAFVTQRAATMHSDQARETT